MTVLAAIGENEEADRIVSLGYDLAERYDERVVVLHVVPLEDFDEHRETIEASRDYDISISQEQDSAARFAYRVVREALGEFDDARVETRGRVADPTEGILREIETVDPRFLVIGGRRRSPVGKALFGSVTQEVLLQADCPVVTIMSD